MNICAVNVLNRQMRKGIMIYNLKSLIVYLFVITFLLMASGILFNARASGIGNSNNYLVVVTQQSEVTVKIKELLKELNYDVKVSKEFSDDFSHDNLNNESKIIFLDKKSESNENKYSKIEKDLTIFLEKMEEKLEDMKGVSGLERDASKLIKKLKNGIDDEKEFDSFADDLNEFLEELSEEIKDDKKYEDFVEEADKLNEYLENYNDYENYNEVETYLAGLSNSLEDAWDDVEEGIEDIGEELEAVFSDLFSVIDTNNLSKDLGKKIQSLNNAGFTTLILKYNR